MRPQIYPMKCQQCLNHVDDTLVVIEWLSNRNGLHLVESIRIVHSQCQYAYSKPRTMELLDLYDHWLPYWTLEDLVEIAHEKTWDNTEVARAIFTDYIKHRHSRIKPRGTNETD